MIVGWLRLVRWVVIRRTTILLVDARLGLFEVFIVVIKALRIVMERTSAMGIARVDAWGRLSAVCRLRDARARHAGEGDSSGLQLK
jgi:hypothetical protein